MASAETRHTPGPWICYADLPSTDPNWHIVTTANKMRVLANVHIEPGNAMDAANARLITAAPDLFRVAERLAYAASMEPGQDRLAAFQIVADEARAAIAKATGSAS